MGGEDRPGWPEWWNWDLAFTAHLEERMLMRGLSEVELRAMLEVAVAVQPARHRGRWVVRTRHAGTTWKVVVEPDEVTRQVVVVTAYQSES